MFISKINELLDRKKMSTQKLSELSGVSRQAIFKARSDEGISECRLSTLARIATALGVKTKRLYDETDSQAEG